MVSIVEIVGEAVSQLCKKYLQREILYLSESDAVCSLFSILNELSLSKGLAIHSQLRPFYGSVDSAFIIKSDKNGKIEWQKQRKANEGAVVDLCVIDEDEKYWRKAYAKALRDQNATNRLKYWRILSYPVEALRVAVEVKVKVYRNIRRIRTDLDKLAKIGEKNPSCVLYLVVLDRAAEPTEALKQIKKYSKEHEVNCVMVLKSTNQSLPL